MSENIFQSKTLRKHYDAIVYLNQQRDSVAADSQGYTQSRYSLVNMAWK